MEAMTNPADAPDSQGHSHANNLHPKLFRIYGDSLPPELAPVGRTS